MDRKPDWFKIKLPDKSYSSTVQIIKNRRLNTVCVESKCPNISECWSGGTATFMVLGDTCTRACRFCNVRTGFPARPIDPLEPENLGLAVSELCLKYVVITSVDRDDLADQGSEHVAKCIRAVRERNREIIVEVLIPDFRGNKNCIDNIMRENPDVMAHNIETVRRLQKVVRDPRANYDQSIGVLKYIKEKNPAIHTKSSIMLGLGETGGEVIQTMHDLKNVGVSFLTLGQYLRPSPIHLEVKEYIPPENFEYYRTIGEEIGFLYVASGPLVRSSYRAGELFIKNVLRKQGSYEESLRY